MPGSLSGLTPGEIRIALDDLGRDDPAPLRLSLPEVAEADERVVVPPLLTPLDARPLDAPERPRRRITTGRHLLPGVFHLVGEGMEDADHHYAVGAAVEAPVDDRGDLVPAIEDTSVREHSHAAGGESRRQIPLPPAVEALERPLLAHRLVLGPVELVDLLLEPTAIELHQDEVSPIWARENLRPALRARAPRLPRPLPRRLRRRRASPPHSRLRAADPRRGSRE